MVLKYLNDIKIFKNKNQLKKKFVKIYLFIF